MQRNIYLFVSYFRIRPAYEEKQEAILTALLTRTFTDHVIVFIKTKAQCHRLHIILGLLGLRSAQLHGNMSQAQRLESLKLFKEEQIDILLTTDVAARGLDISGVQTVINFQLPNNLEQYIHRVGRTARAGNYLYKMFAYTKRTDNDVVCIGQMKSKCHTDLEVEASKMAPQNFSLAVSLAKKIGYSMPSKGIYIKLALILQKDSQNQIFLSCLTSDKS